MILVIGSTGMVGNEVCRLLSSKNLQVKAMIRSKCEASKQNKQKGPESSSPDLFDF